MKTRSTIAKRTLKTFGFFTVLMIAFLSTNTLQAQSSERTVTGVVNSLDGPVMGASIVLKGTAIGIFSDENGEFTFPEKLNENDVLVISYLGYKTGEVKIKGDSSFVKPFLEDNAILIVAALRTESKFKEVANKN